MLVIQCQMMPKTYFQEVIVWLVAVYSEAGMARLKAKARVIFLDVSVPALKQRVRNFETRGVARRPDQSFEDLFAERRALYQHYADISLDCSHLGVNEALQAIVDRLQK